MNREKIRTEKRKVAAIIKIEVQARARATGSTVSRSDGRSRSR